MIGGEQGSRLDMYQYIGYPGKLVPDGMLYGRGNIVGFTNRHFRVDL